MWSQGAVFFIAQGHILCEGHQMMLHANTYMEALECIVLYKTNF